MTMVGPRKPLLQRSSWDWHSWGTCSQLFPCNWSCDKTFYLALIQWHPGYLPSASFCIFVILSPEDPLPGYSSHVSLCTRDRKLLGKMNGLSWNIWEKLPLRISSKSAELMETTKHVELKIHQDDHRKSGVSLTFKSEWKKKEKKFFKKRVSGCVNVYLKVYVWVCVCMNVYIWVCMRICECICIYNMCVCEVHTWMCSDTCVNVSMCVRECVCQCTYDCECTREYIVWRYL